MKNPTRWLVPCLLGLLATAPLLAADPHQGFGQRISLDLVEAAPADVFASFGRVVGREVVVDPAVAAPVTIRLQKVTAGTALQAICESIDCFWRFEGGKLTIRPRPKPGEALTAPSPRSGTPSNVDPGSEPISLSLREARLEDVLHSFSKILEVPIDVAPELADAPVTIELQSVAANEALAALLRIVGGELVEVSAEPRRLAVRKLP